MRKHQPTLSTRNLIPSQGFTMVELVAGIAMTLVIGSLALQALTNAQQDFTSDTSNIENGQKLSSVLDIVGRDLKQAGEEINEPLFPVIQVINDGAKGSRLVVYRAIGEPLPLCSEIAANAATTSIPVSSTDAAAIALNASCQSEAPPATSLAAAYSQCNAFSVKLRDWCVKRNKGSLPGVIHDQSGKLYPFSYVNENTNYSSPTNITNNSINIVSASFTPSQKIPFNSTVYLSEKREYLICDNELKVWINSNSSGCPVAGYTDASYQTIATGIEKMDVITSLRKPVIPTVGNPNPADEVLELSANSAFPTTIATVDYTWQNIQGLKIAIRSKVSEDAIARINNNSALSTSAKQSAIKGLEERATVEGRFYPRNVLSAKKKG